MRPAGGEPAPVEPCGRVLVIFEMLVSLFERAYLLLYEPELSPKAARRWNSWTDYMHEWCRREDFRLALRLSGRLADARRISSSLTRKLGGSQSSNWRE